MNKQNNRLTIISIAGAAAIIIIAVIIVIIMNPGAKPSFQTINSTPGPSGNPYNTESPLPEVTLTPEQTVAPIATEIPVSTPTSGPDENPMIYPEDYMPKLNTLCKFNFVYADGSKAKREVITGNPSDSIVLTSVNIEPQIDSETYYYQIIDGALYSTNDLDIKHNIKVLPKDIEKGSAWFDKYFLTENSIVDINQTCNLVFVKFDNCIVVKVHFPEVDYTEIRWYAPGAGNVLTTTEDGKYDYLRLKSISNIKASQATSTIDANAKNLDKLKQTIN